MNGAERPARLLDPGLCLTLRPMVYPTFFEMGRHGLVSDHHYATMPATTWAIYIVPGTIPTSVPKQAPADD